jgi:hypothetical protein
MTAGPWAQLQLVRGQSYALQAGPWAQLQLVRGQSYALQAGPWAQLQLVRRQSHSSPIGRLARGPSRILSTAAVSPWNKLL